MNKIDNSFFTFFCFSVGCYRDLDVDVDVNIDVDTYHRLSTKFTSLTVQCCSTFSNFLHQTTLRNKYKNLKFVFCLYV
jgi:hypothetical protein